MARPRDTQRSKVYAAEAVLPHGLQFPTILDCQAYVNRVLADAWFLRTFGHHAIEVRHGGGSSSARAVGTRLIQLPLWARHQRTILHEIAHCIRPLDGWAKGAKTWSALVGGKAGGWRGYPIHTHHAGHGREYAHTYLMLVQHFMGADAARQLRASFRLKGVKFTAKRVLSPAQREALRARGHALAAARRKPAAILETPAGDPWAAGYLGRFTRTR